MQRVKCIWCHALCTLLIANWLHPPTLPYYTLPFALMPVMPEYVKENYPGVDGSLAVEWRQMTHLAPRGSSPAPWFLLSCSPALPRPHPPHPYFHFHMSFHHHISLTLCSSAAQITDESLPQSSASDPVILASNYGKLTLNTHQMPFFGTVVLGSESKHTAGSTLRPPPMLSWSTVQS